MCWHGPVNCLCSANPAKVHLDERHRYAQASSRPLTPEPNRSVWSLVLLSRGGVSPDLCWAGILHLLALCSPVGAPTANEDDGHGIADNGLGEAIVDSLSVAAIVAIVVVRAGQRWIVDNVRLHDNRLLGHEKHVVPEHAEVLVLLRLFSFLILCHVDLQLILA